MDSIRKLIDIVSDRLITENKVIGHGASRKVSIHPKNNNYVIKTINLNTNADSIENKRIHNGIEYLVYQKMKSEGHHLLPFMAPVIDVADDCEWIIMKRYNALSKTDSLPEQVRSQFNELFDIVPQNFGTHNDDYYLIDYGGEKNALYMGLPVEYNKIIKLIKKYKKDK